MKALTVRQPFPALIMAGLKTLESRTWDTKFRGELLICAGKTAHSLFREYDVPAQRLVLDNYYAPKYYDVPKEFMLRDGQACCVVDVTDVRLMTREDETLACCDWYPDAYVFVLENIRLVEPFEVRGRLNFFEVDDKLIKYL